MNTRDAVEPGEFNCRNEDNIHEYDLLNVSPDGRLLVYMCSCGLVKLERKSPTTLLTLRTYYTSETGRTLYDKKG